MGSNSDRCAGLEIRDGVQCPCLAKRVTLLRYRRPGPDMMGIVFQIYLCPEHGEQFSKWGWKCVDTQLRTEERQLTVEELSKIPPNKLQDTSLPVRRTSVELLDIWLSKQVDPVGVIFNNEPLIPVG